MLICHLCIFTGEVCLDILPIFFNIGLPFFPFIFTYLALHPACGILVPQSGIEPKTPALQTRNPNHLTAREVPWVAFYYKFPLLSESRAFL